MTIVNSHSSARPAAEILAWSKELLDPALRAAVKRLPEKLRRIAGYHFGWWDGQGTPTRAGGGKALRSALVVLCAEAAGGDPAGALPAAVSVELVHNFSLLHDDVMDGDRTRRHRPTAWTVFGKGPAVLTGDALLGLAFEILFPQGTSGAQLLATGVLELISGQAADLDFEQREEVTLGECSAMAEGKTAMLISAACALGAVAAQAGPATVTRFGAFGKALGLAFQHVDDLLGIWGDPGVTGKPVYSDLQSRKKTLPVVAALTSGTGAGAELSMLYRRRTALVDGELVRAAQLVEQAGGRAWSQARAEALLTEGLDELAALDLTARAAAELTTLARLIVTRTH
ncbi:polyprenyl synthetase family protein [Amycolatopsis sp. NBC_00345]|uniref:polyprenyl synthetase family protein n=1 Tax=Amycolatopsis sp. NBC_00345 TaxID=2975955 RepID=UPI002E26037F